MHQKCKKLQQQPMQKKLQQVAIVAENHRCLRPPGNYYYEPLPLVISEEPSGGGWRGGAL